MDTKKAYYYGIDLVRFAAAAMVAFFHIGYSCWASPTSGGNSMNAGTYTIPELAPFIWFGWTGVEIFFVISGFVIINSASRVSAWKFAWGRASRLYPAVWVSATLIAALLLREGHSAGLKRYLASMMLLPTGPWIDGQYWTLGVEIMFYAIVFAMIAISLQRHFGTLAALLIFMGFGANLAATLDPAWIFLASGGWRLLLLTYGAYFGIGITMQQSISRRWSVGSLALLAIGLLACVLETRLHTMGMSRRASNSPIVLSDWWFVSSLVTFMGIGFIAFSAYKAELFSRLPSKVRTLLHQLGLATYPFYLLHFSLGIWLVRNLVSEAGFHPISALITVVAGLAIMAWGIAYFIEPAIRLKLYNVRDFLEALGRSIAGRRGPGALDNEPS